MKREFLVCYEYHHGGVWAYILSDSDVKIKERYPELEIVASKPLWMSPEVEGRIRSTMTIDIEDSKNQLFRALVKQRRTEGPS